MDSLELPYDLIWEGKPEPLSPSQLALANDEDILIFDNDFANDLLLQAEILLDNAVIAAKCVVENDDDDDDDYEVDFKFIEKKTAYELLMELQEHAIESENSNSCSANNSDDDDADQWLDQTINFSPPSPQIQLQQHQQLPLGIYNNSIPLYREQQQIHLQQQTPIHHQQQQQQQQQHQLLLQHQQQLINQSSRDAAAIKVEQTAQLILEFDSVLDAVELTHLTPPQTPPQSPPIHGNYNFDLKQQTEFAFPQIDSIQLQQVPQLQQQQHQNAFYPYEPTQQSTTTSPSSSPPPQQLHQISIEQDIDHEMEVVEELVRSRAEQLPDCWTDGEDAEEDNDDDDEDDEENSSAESSIGFSPRSESSSYYTGSNYSNDDEWSSSSPSSPSTTITTNKKQSLTKHNKSGNDGSAVGKITKRRPRPYGRSSEDKKSRKKEQNKNAATRYRKKKKAEIEVALDEERDLLDIHATLAIKHADVKREIKYLKSLMRELYRAKGLL